MTGCQELSERMVRVAHGQATWLPDELAHLDVCGDCATEWRLIQAGARLGREVDVSAERIMGHLRDRRTEEEGAAARPGGRSLRRWRPTRWVVGLAAAAVLVVAVGVGLRGRGDAAEVPSSGLFVELDDLTPGELELVVGDYVLSSDVAMPSGAAGLSDLSAAELEGLLSWWEGRS